MDPTERLNLQKMIAANDTVDCTEEIRTTKHSDKIGKEVKNLLALKNQYRRLSLSNPEQFDSICVSRCSFLFNNYTDIFNKVKKDEIDLNILSAFLATLKKIEDGKLDQHEASFEIGKLLKKLYIDSALRKADHNDKKSKNKNEPKKKNKKISWLEYKNMQDK